MQLIKKIRRLPSLRVCRGGRTYVVLLLLCLADDAVAEACLAPQRPYVPDNPRAVRDYADIIRNDFELYLREIQSHFRCLDEERRRAFEESREVSEAYGRFLELIRQ